MDNQQPKPGASAETQFDAPVDELAPVLDLIKRNAKTLAIVLGTILIVMGGYAGYEAWQKSTHASTVADVGRILVTTDGMDTVEALEAYLPEAPDNMRPALLMEIATASDNAGEHARAAQAWKQVAELGDASLTPVAALGQAQALAADGKPAEALAVVEAAAPVAPEGYNGIFALRTGVYAEAVGDWAKALAAYQRIRSTTDSDRGFYDYKIAEFQAKLNEKSAPAPAGNNDANG